MTGNPSMLPADKHAIKLLVDKAHAEITPEIVPPEPFSGVEIDLRAIGPDYRAIRVAIADSAWMHRSLVSQVTCWFTSVHVLPTPVSLSDIREQVRIHKRLSLGHRRAN